MARATTSIRAWTARAAPKINRRLSVFVGLACSGVAFAPADRVRLANTDNGRLIFGAALAVHALMLVVALVTALAFSLIVRSSRVPESKP